MNGLLAVLPFFSNKRSETKIDRIQDVLSANGLTGVAKYVSNMPVVTGVEKYLDGVPKKTSMAKYLKNNQSSGVSKYIENKGESKATGVAKYMAKQQLVGNQVPSVSSVDRYLRQQILGKKDGIKVSGVDAFIARCGTSGVTSSVNQYIAKKVAASRVKFDVTGVEKYQIEQEIVARKKAAAIIVERYLKEQMIMAREKAEADANSAAIAAREARLNRSIVELDAESDKNLSAVARYVKKRDILAEDKPPASSVDRYLAGKLIEASKKPVISSVAKYLVNQSIATRSGTKVTGVEKYLKKQVIAEKSAPMMSSVAKYVSKKSLVDKYKPEISGVARYIVGVKSIMSAPTTVVEKYLEGEFIPAEQTSSESRVDRYLREKELAKSDSNVSSVDRYLNERVAIAEEAHIPTRVESYLEKQKETNRVSALSGVGKYLAKQSVLATESAREKATGVEKYLLNAGV